MTKPQVKEFNCATGEEIVRDATDQEIADMEKIRIEHEANMAKLAEQAKAKADLLDKLGISEEEAQLLLS